MGWVTVAGALSGTLKQALSKRSLSHFLGSPRPGRCQWERGQAGAGRTRVFSPCSLCWGGAVRADSSPCVPQGPPGSPRPGSVWRGLWLPLLVPGLPASCVTSQLFNHL